jgi:hypothetical protein
MRALNPWRVGLIALAVAAAGCDQVDYIEIKPDTLVLKQKNNEIWLQGHAMSHTGVHYSRTKVNWSVKDESVAKVDEAGRLTPVKSGITEVVASVGKVKAAMPVSVLFAEKFTVEPNPVMLKEGGGSVELKVKVFDFMGRELRDRSATFKSGDKEVLSMGQNAAFPVNAGTTKVDVQVEELTQSIPVTVEAEKVAKKK